MNLTRPLQFASQWVDLMRTHQSPRSGKRLAKPIKIFGSPSFKGGPATKMGQLSSIAANPGEPYHAVLCLSAVTVPILALKALKAKGVRILVNQNGVYYPEWFPQGYEKRNQYLKELTACADHVFFQSRFALESFEHWVGSAPLEHSILVNPVDLRRFTPLAAPATGPTRVLVFSEINSFTQGLWEAILKIRQSLASLGCEWVFAGDIREPRIFESLGMKDLGQAPDVETHWNLPSQELPQVLRSCHLALHLRHNDVCPNKVLECLASGLWVIGGNSGGTPELIGPAGAAIPVQLGYESPDYPEASAIAREIQRYHESPRRCAEAARAQAEKFGLDQWLQEICERSASNTTLMP